MVDFKTKLKAPAGDGNPAARKPVEWQDCDSEFTQRVVFMQIYGDTGTGRTTLALTAPGPIAIIHASEKINGITQPFVRQGKVIRHINFGGTFRGGREQIAKEANAKLEVLKAALNDSMEWARTIILDTHSEAWELLRLARFGTVTPKGQIASLYGPVNAEWNGMFKGYRDQDQVNFIAIGMTREQYRMDKPTGKMEQAGQKDFKYAADVRIKMSRTKGNGFSALIEKGWWNASIEGTSFEDELANFPFMMGMITETDEEEWNVPRKVSK